MARIGSGDTGDGVVFVYGTLRPGRVNGSVAAPFCTHHEPAILPGFALFELAYPVVAPTGPDVASIGPGGGVRGDLLWLDPARLTTALDRLDAFEGYRAADPERSLYRRERHGVVAGDGRRLDAWIYVPGVELLAQVHPDRRVPGDDWPG